MNAVFLCDGGSLYSAATIWGLVGRKSGEVFVRRRAVGWGHPQRGVSANRVVNVVYSFLRKRLRWVLIPVALLLVLILGAAALLVIVSPRLTPYLEGPAFRAELDKQTSKGLHFQGQYEEIKRTGFDTATVKSFHAKDGVKAMRKLDATGISAKFNPWGVFLRRWQLDYVHIKKGAVEVQVYEPKPDNKPPRPWYAIFLPDRVHLSEVTCDEADITWRMQGKPGGIFDTRVRILPYGRDFEYFAEGGTLRSGGLAPDLEMRKIHMVITKKILELYELRLAPKENDDGEILVKGEMGMREDKHVKMALAFHGVPIAPWMPKDLGGRVRGMAKGRVVWKGDEQSLEASSGEGEFAVTGGRLSELPVLAFLASATAKKGLEEITLARCDVKFQWKYPHFEITSVDIEAEEKVAIRGSISLNGQKLGGTLDLGLGPQYLEWLPKAREQIFTREKDGMLWTKVKLSGSLSEPRDDLTPRLAEALKKDPAAAAGLLLRSTGEWIEQKMKGERGPEKK